MNTPKHNRYKYILTILCVFFIAIPWANAQLTVTTGQTAAVLASTLAGPGVTILNPTLTCPGVANGKFTSTGTLLAMNSGIILTTGHAAACVGPNGAPPGTASFNNGVAGDPALGIYLPTGTTTYDACILQFDVVAAGDSIGFNYQFGSQEYYHSTCGQYPDIFAFFISGPGIVGAPNIALVPGTNIPVEINSVNAGAAGGPGGLGPGVNIANCTSLGAGAPFTAYFINNWGGAQLSYTGFTTKFRAVHAVTPCDTYHLKLSIADAANSLYDSGVFLEANSLTPPIIPAPPAICVGATTTLSSPLAGGVWSSSNTSVATIGASTGIATGVGGGTATITYSFGAGCNLTTTLTVTALAPITGTTTMCINDTTTLTDAAGGGTWSSSNTVVATINATTGFVTGISAGTATIIYTLPTGCFATVIVTVNPNPATITGSTSVCTGYTITLSDATTGGAWASNNITVATISPTGVVTGVSSGTATITYTLAGGCYITTTITVNTVYASTLNISICQGSSYTFGGTVYTAAGTYSHTYTTTTCDSLVTLYLTVNPLSNTVLNDSICNGTSYTFAGAVYTTTGTYTYHTTNVYGCDSAVTLNLFVKPVPPPPIVVSPVVYCQGQTATQLIATGAGLIWYTVSIGGTGSAVVPTPSTTTPGTTWYYVSQNLNGCEGPQNSIKVVVYATPVAAISAGRTHICQHDSTLLSAGPVPAGTTYLWSNPGSSIISGSNTGQSIVIKFDTLGNHLVFLTVSINGQCTSTDSILIHIFPAPIVSFYVKPDVCLGDTVVVAVSAITSGVTNCIWNFEDANIISVTNPAANGGPYYVFWNATGIHFISMYATIDGQCYSKTVTDTIDVHPLPDAQFTELSPGTICTGDTVLFSALEKDPGNIYYWSPEHFFNNISRDEIYGRIEQAGYVNLDVTSPFGCKGSYSLMINAEPCCSLVFPNAFTPNGDGKNDIFRPITTGHHPVHIFSITNRWGQTVFETVDERSGWDGQFNGVPQDMGVYFYYIKYDCNGKTLEEKGDVTLVR